MNKIYATFFILMVLSACISPKEYNNNMKIVAQNFSKIDESIKIQNRNNADYLERISDLDKLISQHKIAQKLREDEFERRLNEFEKFRKAHAKRWPHLEETK